jgi:predicted membrane channel-forming protein YqfA (hemolysin III family)
MEKRDPGKTNQRYLITCIAAILIAVVWFAFDVYKILCNPDSVLQPHSLWHFFASVSAFYFYMYIRSEKNKI